MSERQAPREELRRVCAEATGGMRVMYNGWGPDPQGKMHVLKVGGPFDSIFEASGGGDIVGLRADFEFLNAASPAVVSALLAEVEEKTRALEFVALGYCKRCKLGMSPERECEHFVARDVLERFSPVSQANGGGRPEDDR